MNSNNNKKKKVVSKHIKEIIYCRKCYYCTKKMPRNLERQEHCELAKEF